MKNLPPIDPQSYQPLREQVYSVIRSAVLSGALHPGDQLTEVGIAEQLNVSRTPAREAIHMLEQEGLIVLVPRKGAFVTGIKSKKEISDIFQVRIVLEGLAAALAAERITPRHIADLNYHIEQVNSCIENEDVKGCIRIDTAFHKLICQAADNEVLERILDNLFEQITRFRAASLTGQDRMKAALEEHKELADALAARDPQRARDVAIKHLHGAEERVLSVFRHQYSDADDSWED